MYVYRVCALNIIACECGLILHQGEAVLFYDVTPDGLPDDMAEHGGCPVLRGVKWAANLWVWNDGNPSKSESAKLSLKFINKLPDGPQAE